MRDVTKQRPCGERVDVATLPPKPGLGTVALFILFNVNCISFHSSNPFSPLTHKTSITKAKRTHRYQEGGRSKSGLIPSGSTPRAEDEPVPAASVENENSIVYQTSVLSCHIASCA